MDGVPLSDETSPSVEAHGHRQMEVARSTPVVATDRVADTNWQMGLVHWKTPNGKRKAGQKMC